MKETTDADREVGMRIRTLRKRQDLSQTSLGQAIGVTFQQVQKYEVGVNRIAHNRLAAIAGVLGCSVSDILGLDDAPAGPGLTGLSDHAFALAQAYDRIPDGAVKAALRELVLAHGSGQDGAHAEGPSPPSGPAADCAPDRP